jgi:DNA replication ATP-dependent helicase Dna2
LRKHGLEEKLFGGLKENFRLNEDLCSLPRAKLYGQGYQSQMEAKFRTLQFPHQAPADDRLLNLARQVLADERSLIAIRMPNLDLAGNVNLDIHPETQLAALLAAELWHFTKPEDRQDFWQKRLFIVTPRHVQRLAVRKTLIRAGFEADTLFVDTVEKMQGQEADVVIVCYGMWTKELLEGGHDFVYSRNRINVRYDNLCCAYSLTKCVKLNPSEEQMYLYCIERVIGTFGARSGRTS